MRLIGPNHGTSRMMAKTQRNRQGLRTPYNSIRELTKWMLGPRLSVVTYESAILKQLKHPLFVRADLRIEHFRRKLPTSNRTQLLAGPAPKIIWQYWDSGWESAPPISKFSSEVSQHVLHDFEFRRISMSDLQYLDIISSPLMSLYSNGHISKAGLADILRLRLIERFGGYWLDATALVVQKWELSDVELLSYHRSGSVPGKFWFNNWFIGGDDLRYFAGQSADLLESYWLFNDRQPHYFDAFFAMKRIALAAGSPRASQTSSISIPLASSLMKELRKGSPNAVLMKNLKASPVHKLSYKSVNQERMVSVLQDLLRGSV